MLSSAQIFCHRLLNTHFQKGFRATDARTICKFSIDRGWPFVIPL